MVWFLDVGRTQQRPTNIAWAETRGDLVLAGNSNGCTSPASTPQCDYQGRSKSITGGMLVVCACTRLRSQASESLVYRILFKIDVDFDLQGYRSSS